MTRFYLSVVLLFAASVVARADNPQVTLQVTGAVSGAVVIELYPDEAPVTVANFVNYVQSGFYDGLIFHRVIADFMIQGGGFTTELVKQETNPPIINESSNGLSNLRGTIAMARTPYPDSATSEFFINLADNTFLDNGELAYDLQYNVVAKIGYCVFGQVVSGMDVVDAIAAVTTETVDDMHNVPVDDVIIQHATVTLDGPVCADKLAGDANGDCRVDFADLVELSQNWLACNSLTATCP